MKKSFGFIIFLIFSLITIVFVKFGSALAQESNSFQIIKAIIKLEISDNGYEKVSKNNKEIIYVSEYKKKNPFGMPIEYMKNLGWSYEEQTGSGFIFLKNDKSIVVETRKYTRDYYLWEIPTEVQK